MLHVIVCKSYWELTHNALYEYGNKFWILLSRHISMMNNLHYSTHMYSCIIWLLSQLLLNSGCDVNQTYKQAYGFTPLHICAGRGDPWTCRLLLLYGAYPFARDNQGRTPLDIACEHPLLRAWLELYQGMFFPNILIISFFNENLRYFKCGKRPQSVFYYWQRGYFHDKFLLRYSYMFKWVFAAMQLLKLKHFFRSWSSKFGVFLVYQ